MKPMNKLIATTACAGALMIAAGTYAAPASNESGPDSVTGRHGPSHHAGWRRGGHRGGFGHVCGKRREARTERMISVVEGLMTFTPNQEAAWQDLTKTIRDGNKSMDQTCSTLKHDRDKPQDATQRFARMETIMAAGLKFVQAVRPKFDSFYATLNDKQKKAIDTLSNRRRLR
jgi:hypothetical protein